MAVTAPDASKYGMIAPGLEPGSVAGLVEKPTSANTPSLQASIGRYVLEAEIFDLLRNQAPGAGGEIQLADAIDTRAGQGQVHAVPLKGQRYDCGSKFGYLEAIVDFALTHDEYGDDFRRHVQDRVQRVAVD
jgi:UTP--glucose-1-phosphate uridylyltransferase